MRVRFIAAACILALCPVAATAFDSAELRGLWAESTQNRYACTSTNRYQHFELAADGKTLTISFEPRARTGKPSFFNSEIDIFFIAIGDLSVHFTGGRIDIVDKLPA